ncbi:MAG: trimethylamine methyltransferase family protein [Pseudomonadota bacterium]
MEQALNRSRPERRGGRGRAPKSAERVANYRQLRHPFTPLPLFSDDEVANMHETALKVLEELGIKVLLDEARDLYRAAGAIVNDDTQMVFIGREVVAAALENAPSSFRIRSISAERDQQYELGTLMFMAGAGCPNATDRVRGRRPGSLRDFTETLKLQQSFDAIHMLGPSAEPQDVPPNLRHYAMMKAQLTLSDKPAFLYSRGKKQAEESFELLKCAIGLSDEEFEQDVWTTTVINSNSPRQLDRPMSQGIIDFARAGQVSIITPFCLSGAMAPVTTAGSLTLQHAEAMAGITLAQLARKGAPVSYGGFSSNVDMKSGSPAFGTPEHVKACLGSGQLARHIGLPWRSAAGSASNLSDAQGAQENTMALWGAMMAGATVIIHSAGWLEGGLCFGYEKFVNDMDAIQSLAELCAPTAGNDSEIGFEALSDVQPGGHFFVTQHTMDRYSTAFYPPINYELSNHGSWIAAGGKNAEERATAIWQDRLETFEPPKACMDMEERLEPLIARMTEAGGAAPLD